MKRDKIQLFSLRKLSVGLVSTSIASIFLLANSNVSLASNNSYIEYKYVSEDELTDSEKQTIIKELPTISEKDREIYYLVYRPNKSDKFLPNTGMDSDLNVIATSAAILFLVVAVTISKKGKKKITSVVLITTLGSAILSPESVAVYSKLLSQYNDSFNVEKGNKLPIPNDIPNYKYVGYIKISDNNSDKLLNKEELNKIDNESDKHNPVLPEVDYQDIVSKETIPYETEYQREDELAYGKRETVQAGVNGEKEIVKDARTNEIKKETETKKEINEIIKVGTEPTVTVKELPYATEEKADNTLFADERQVDVVGKKGQEKTTTTYELDTKTGKLTANQPTVERIEPTTEVVRVGTKSTETKIVEKIPYETEYQREDKLGYGKRETVQAGVNGEKEVVKDARTNEIKKETETKKEINEIIKVGTEPTVTVKELPYTTEEKADNTLFADERQVDVVGKKGQEKTTTTYELDTKTGKLTANQPTVERIEPTTEVVRVGTKDRIKTTPTVAIASITKDEDNKSVTVNYKLNDIDSAYVSAKALLYKGDELVREIAINNISDSLTISGLNYFTNYTLKTELSYNIGKGNENKVQESNKDIYLEYKKIEFKDIKFVELYEKNGDTIKRKELLDSIPTNVDNYFIKIKSVDNKNINLPIASIVEVTEGGDSVYKVKVELPELVQDQQGRYKPNAEFYIPKNIDSDNDLLNKYKVDYQNVTNSELGRNVVYKNVEKLIPFYNKEYIVELGNKIDISHKLSKVELLDVVPMLDNEVILDVNTNKSFINRLMLHYANNTVDYVDLTYKGDFKNNKIAEYSIQGTDLIYTPEMFLNSYRDIIDTVSPILSSVQLYSEDVHKALKIDNDSTALINELYFEKTFNNLKNNLSEELAKILSVDSAINTPEGAVKDSIISKIKDNATPLMLGLSYLNRWYNINYNYINIKDLSAYKTDFFGKQSDSILDNIIKLGNSGISSLRASANVSTFANTIGKYKGIDNLFDYLEKYRELFLPNKSNNEWLKENSKAYIVETLSSVPEAREKQENNYGQKNNKYSVGVYDKITSNSWRYKQMLLPLITLEDENTYIISNMSSLSMGGYERYTNSVPNDMTLSSFVRKKVEEAAIWQRNHLDFWYKVLGEQSKDKLFDTILTYDGFQYSNNGGGSSWRTLYDKDNSIQQFFGPVGKYYKNNGSGAYATGQIINYVVYRILDYAGSSTYTHEMTHNFDGKIYFEGKGRREGLGAELFATGLLQTAEARGHNVLGLNTMFVHSKNALDRYHTANPNERYQSMKDVDDYVHRMFDVIYTLEYAESQAILKQNTDIKKKWLRKIENKYITDRDGKTTHAGNVIRPLTDDEATLLTSLDSLIDQDIINRRAYRNNEELGRNGYYEVSLFSPIYSALSNSNGAPGDLMFKRMAFELMAAKGYVGGFLPYASNQFSKDAFDSGQKTWSSWHGRYVGLVTDDLVFDKVLSKEYDSWASFKKEMYKERINKVSNLKPITIEYELGVPKSTKKVTITSFEQLQRLVDEAMALDISNVDRTTSHVPASWVHLLHSKIYNAFLRETDDFRTTIYN
ncbi:G5 domain-containing protein [Gemella sp. GH3]|uniref:ZmpA/ZmpB/ZmpC family metallo-endopeptidase n=1 Tax=unclassified Gemella TaxID=2624949 RepID=UPI0015D04FAC|nr:MULTISPECIES: ZmpA/ZmpB/ZmpC family metallo-endopeptidase [unclassified Gemella]MBF0713707.1 G5 domain-containing protein [Gemella sp. GH3.1]NYS50659.1 G5 domain-containing protein [Gemella sp. GH3]